MLFAEQIQNLNEFLNFVALQCFNLVSTQSCYFANLVGVVTTLLHTCGGLY